MQLELQRSDADSCMFRRLADREVVAVIIVYVDDILPASKTRDDEERAISNLRSRSRVKGPDEADFY